MDTGCLKPLLKPHNQSADQAEPSISSPSPSRGSKKHKPESPSKWEKSIVVHTDSSSCGFIIDGRKVVMNANSIEKKNTQQVRLKKLDSAETYYVARVLAIGTDCDLALLTVDNDEFWKDVSPVQFGSLPTLLDAVTIVGCPNGKDKISDTSAYVSCIQTLSYSQASSTQLLCLQINASTILQNFVGPAFNNQGQCVGISLQSLKDGDSEDTGYLIPTPVLLHFTNDYENSKQYTGFPVLGVEWQNMVNPALRKAMGMTQGQEGIRVVRVDPTSPASQYLKRSDIILKFDGVSIANDGTVPFWLGGRICFSHLLTHKYTGDTAVIEILRHSEVHEFNIKLGTHKSLIPCGIQGFPSSYYIVGGLMFTALSNPHLYSEDYNELFDFPPNSPDDQIVVISQVLEAEIEIGYEKLTNARVTAFNGKPIKSLKDLANLIDKCNEEFLEFDLENRKIIVFDTKTTKAATLDILAKHGIPSAISDDLKS